MTIIKNLIRKRKMVRKLARITLFLFLVYLPISFVVNQFTMRDKLSATAEKFEQVVDDHQKRGIRFSGELDSLLVERNQILIQEKFLKVGNWHSTSFFRTELVMYLNASWMPDDIYHMMAKIYFSADTADITFGEYFFFVLFLFLPIFLYLGGWYCVLFILQKPAQ